MSSKISFTDKTQFPTDCTNRFLSYVDLKSLGRFCRVSKECNVLGSVEKLWIDKLPKELVSIVPRKMSVKKFCNDRRAVLSDEEVLQRVDSFLNRIEKNGQFLCYFPLKESTLIIRIGRTSIDLIEDSQTEFCLKEACSLIKEAGVKKGISPTYSSIWGPYVSAVMLTDDTEYTENSLYNHAQDRVYRYIEKINATCKIQKIVTILGLIGFTLGLGLASKQS